MSLFEYVTVMVSMILALALGRLLMSASSLAKNRHKVVPHAPYVLWLCFLFLTLINHWWSLWDLRDISWTYLSFVYILIAPTLIFFGVGLLVHEGTGDDPIDLPVEFERVRPLFLLLMTGYVTAMWFDGPLFAGQNPLGLVGIMHLPLVVAYLVALPTKARSMQLATPILGLSAITVIMVIRFLS